MENEEREVNETEEMDAEYDYPVENSDDDNCGAAIGLLMMAGIGIGVGLKSAYDKFLRPKINSWRNQKKNQPEVIDIEAEDVTDSSGDENSK